jgi:hypothetical protein
LLKPAVFDSFFRKKMIRVLLIAILGGFYLANRMNENLEAPEGAKNPGREPGADDERLWRQLENAVTLAAKQDQIVWVIFGVFCAAEAVLLAALFQSGGPPQGYVGPVVSIVAIAISFVWAWIQHRAIAWLRFYEDRGKELENLLRPVVRLLTDRQNKVAGVTARPLMVACPWVSAIIWFAALWFFLHKAGETHNFTGRGIF